MKCLRLPVLVLCAALTSGMVGRTPGAMNKATATGRATIEAGTIVVARYRLDAGRSQFMVRAFAGGPLFFKGHDHFVKVGDFTGEAELTPDALNPAALHLRVRADSLEETRDVFTPQQKQIINKELREIVLETSKYPEITFNSTDVTGRDIGAIESDLRILTRLKHYLAQFLVDDLFLLWREHIPGLFERVGAHAQVQRSRIERVGRKLCFAGKVADL